MLDGLDIGAGTQSALAGGKPIVDRPLDQSAFRTMMREELGLRDHWLWEALLEHLGYASMQLSPRTTQQCAVGGVLHERVLEGVFCVGRSPPPPEDQLGAHEL